MALDAARKAFRAASSAMIFLQPALLDAHPCRFTGGLIDDCQQTVVSERHVRRRAFLQCPKTYLPLQRRAPYYLAAHFALLQL